MTLETPDPQSEPETTNPNTEAARWRVRLRETEAEASALRDTLQATTDALQASREALVAEHCRQAGLKPEALAAAHQVGEFFGDDGAFNPEALANAVADTRERFGIRVVNYVPSAGTGGTSGTRSATPWADALRDRYETPRQYQVDGQGRTM